MSFFITSDTHFFHRNIIGYCNRPFQSMEQMNEVLIERWNAKVPPDSLVLHLGDFFVGGKTDEQLALLGRMNGTIVLIQGNHDTRGMSARVRKAFKSAVPNFRIIGDYAEWYCEHYPKDQWYGQLQGVLHAHGHSHGNAPRIPCRIDVGVDPQGFEPLSELEAFRKLGFGTPSDRKQDE